MSWDVTELGRRMAQMIRIGVVDSVDLTDATQPRCVVKIGPLTSPPIPWIAPRAGNDAELWAPEPGEQAVILSPFGDLAQAVALVGLYQSNFPAPGTDPDIRTVKYKDGAAEQYDRAAHKYSFTIPTGGSFTFQVGSTAMVLNETGLNITNGDVTADGHTLKLHTHIDSRGGQTSGPTG